jgi:hypothetical protein
VEGNGSNVQEAPRVRQLAGAALDIAVGAGLAWVLGTGRRGDPSEPRPPLTARLVPGALLRAVGPSSELVREQLGSPGQRLLGLRTVDRRTGARLALWRTLLLLAYRGLSQQIVSRRRDGPSSERRQALLRELGEIHRRHAENDDARESALRDFYATQPQISVHRSFVPLIGVGLLGALLRRRLAPTVEVRAGKRGG